MSKNYPEKEVDVNDMDQEELTALANDEEETAAPAKKKHVFSRLLAVILALAPIALVCFLPITIFYASNGSYVFNDEITLLKVFTNLFKKDGVEEIYKLAGVSGVSDFSSFAFHGVPLLNAGGTYGKVYSWLLYAFPVVFVLNIILMLVGIFSGKKAPAMVRSIAFWNLMLFGGYALLILFLSSMSFNSGDKHLFDIFVVSIAGASLLFYIIYSFVKRKGKATLPFILLILMVAFVGVYAYAYFHYEMSATFDTIYAADKKFIGSLKWGTAIKYLVRGLVVLYALAIFISLTRLPSKKGYGFDIFRYILHFLLALAVLYPCFFEIKDVVAKDALSDLKWFAVAAAGIAFVQIILAIIAKAQAKKEAEEEEYEDYEEETLEEAPVQQTEEAPAYTAPVAAQASEAQTTAPAAEEVEEEQLVMPDFSSFNDSEETEELEPAPTSTIMPVENAPEEQEQSTAPAGYDFYNTKSFDPFIASLNDKEREQFTDLFILKYKGTMSNIPDYEVGGDNSDFFRKVFIFLGQYRDRIPDGLLAKMYKFYIKK